MVSPNSLEAYNSLVGLSDKQRHVFVVVEAFGKPINNRKLSELLGWSINRVTPRVLELREKGLLVEAVSAIDPVTRRKTSFWKVRE